MFTQNISRFVCEDLFALFFFCGIGFLKMKLINLPSKATKFYGAGHIWDSFRRATKFRVAGPQVTCPSSKEKSTSSLSLLSQALNCIPPSSRDKQVVVQGCLTVTVTQSSKRLGTSLHA